MSCARTSQRQHSGRSLRAFRHRHLGLTLFFLVFAASGQTTPASAQATDVPPDVLPPLPQNGFGLPSPLVPPNALYNGTPLPTPGQAPGSLQLPPVSSGVTTLQAYDPNAPAIMVLPSVTVGERFTDNANYSSTNRTGAAETFLEPGLTISADTPRLQGVLTGNLQGTVYTPTSNLDRLWGNFYASGLGTVVPDKVFVDVRSSISEASTLPGLGFVSPSLLPSNQQTQVYANTVSPYLRESIDGLVDTELRYRFGSTNYGGNIGVTTGTSGVPVSNLASGVLNEGTFTAATGENFERGLSRLTVDDSDFNSNSTSRNTQFSAYDDLEYRFTPDIAALARVGYQNIQYPLAPLASYTGATWLAGGRIGALADYAYLALEYGVQQGVYGFTGSAAYQITPTMNLTATLVQGISSPTQYFQTALATSSLNPFGAIVDQYSGLPTAFYNPGLGLTNNVYREHLFNLGVTDTVGYNQYSLYGYYSNQQALTPPITAPTNSRGGNFTWSRSIRPDLNSNASVGYFNTTNVATVTSTTPISSINTITANVGLNYLFGATLTGSVIFSFSYQTNGAALVSGQSGNVVANSLQFLLTKTF